MDLKQYFRKVREVERALTEPYPVLVSLETSDGGKEGVLNEVHREVAAKLIADGKAVLATENQKSDFLAQRAAAKKAADKVDLARRVQVAILADTDLQDSLISRKTDLQGAGK